MSIYRVKTDDGSTYNITTDDGASISEQPQGIWGAVKSALANRPELQPLGIPSVPSSNPVTAAGQTLALPIRTGQTLARGLEFPSDIGNAVGYPATGRAISGALQMLPGAIGEGEGSLSTRVLEPNIPESRLADVQRAQQSGIPLTRAEMTGSMPTARVESFLEKTPLGSKPIQNFRTTQKMAVDNLINNAKGQYGTSESPTLSGMTARESLQNELMMNKQTANDLYRQVPDVQIPTPRLQSVAQDIIQEQGKLPTSSQNPQIIKMASDYLNMGSPGYAGTPPSFQIMNKIRSDLGDIVRNGSGTDRMYASRLQAGLDNDLENFGKQNIEGPEFSQAFPRAQGYYKNMVQLQNNPLVKKLQNSPFQDMPDLVFKKGDPQNVLTAQAALGDEGYEPLKRQFFNELITSKNLPKQLDNYGDEFLNTAFSPGEVNALKSASSAQKLSLGAEKLSGNPSGTGQTILSGATGASILDAMRRFPSHPISSTLEAATTVGGPYLGAKAYLSPWMTQGIPLKATPGMARGALTLMDALTPSQGGNQ